MRRLHIREALIDTMRLVLLLIDVREPSFATMIRTRASISALLAILATSGCVWFGDLTEGEPISTPIADDTPAAAPFTPTTEYDFVGSRASSQAGDAALNLGKSEPAVGHYQAAIAAWPANEQAWTGLAVAYQTAGSEADIDHALFFARRLAWADSVPAASAAAGFRNVAAGQINRPVEDPRTPMMAEQLALYYAGLDVAQRMAQVGNRAEPQDALDALGFVPALVGTAALSIFVGAQAVGVLFTD